MTLASIGVRALLALIAALIAYRIVPELLAALALGFVVWFVFLRPWQPAPQSRAIAEPNEDDWSAQMFPSQDTPLANDLRRNGASTPGMSEHMNVTGNEDREDPSRW